MLDEFRHVTIGLEMTSALLRGEKFDFMAREKADAGKPKTRAVDGERDGGRHHRVVSARGEIAKPLLVGWIDHQAEHYGKLVSNYRMTASSRQSAASPRRGRRRLQSARLASGRASACARCCDPRGEPLHVPASGAALFGHPGWRGARRSAVPARGRLDAAAERQRSRRLARMRRHGAKNEWYTTRFVRYERILGPTQFSGRAGPSGVILNGPTGRTANLCSERAFGDIELYLDFMLAKGSNSGVYLQGLYEMQIFDSWGSTEEMTTSDAGAIYHQWIENRGVAAPRHGSMRHDVPANGSRTRPGSALRGSTPPGRRRSRHDSCACC